MAADLRLRTGSVILDSAGQWLDVEWERVATDQTLHLGPSSPPPRGWQSSWSFRVPVGRGLPYPYLLWAQLLGI